MYHIRRNYQINRKGYKGFTLVELVVVITIMAILMALAIVTINTVRRQSRNAQLRNDAQTIKAAIEAYRISSNNYPPRPGLSSPPSTYDPLLDRNAYSMVQPGGSLSQYISGDPPTNPSSNGATVCYNYVNSTRYNLWVITEEGMGSGCPATLSSNPCPCGYASASSNNIYSTAN